MCRAVASTLDIRVAERQRCDGDDEVNRVLNDRIQLPTDGAAGKLASRAMSFTRSGDVTDSYRTRVADVPWKFEHLQQRLSNLEKKN